MVPHDRAQLIRRRGPAAVRGPHDGPGVTPEAIEFYLARGRRLRAEAMARLARRLGAALVRPLQRRRPGDAAAEEETVVAVTHQLRTPLTAIRSFSEILRDNPDIPREQRIAFLDTILEESDRLNRSITEVIDGLNGGRTRSRGERAPARQPAG